MADLRFPYAFGFVVPEPGPRRVFGFSILQVRVGGRGKSIVPGGKALRRAGAVFLLSCSAIGLVLSLGRAAWIGLRVLFAWLGLTAPAVARWVSAPGQFRWPGASPNMPSSSRHMLVHTPPVPAPNAARILVTGTSSDAHTWNLIFLQKYVAEAGHEVINLGPCVPESLLVETCLRLLPDLIVVSSVNGHGVPDGLRAIAAIRAIPVLASRPVVIGGKLTTTGALSTAQLGQLAAAGFDAVFNDTDLAPFRLLLTGAAGSPHGTRRLAASA